MSQKLSIHNCIRCRHEWSSRMIERPRRCAKCGRPNWWKPVRIPKQIERSNPVGRPRMYPVNFLEIGQSMILEWNKLPNGYLDSYRNKVMNIAIQNYAKRTGKTFRREGRPCGLKITRLA